MEPILQLYRGYANEQELIVMGHILKKGYDYDFQKKSFKNATSIVNLFKVKTIKNFDVYLKFGDSVIHTKTLDDGYFTFCIPLEKEFSFGWMDYEVSIQFKNKSITAIADEIHQGSETLCYLGFSVCL